MTRWLLFLFISLSSTSLFADASEVQIEGYSTAPATSATVTAPLVEKTPEVVKSMQPASASTKVLWQTFFTKLSACDPGLFELRQINPLLAQQYGDTVTNQIMGADNNKCHLVTMYYSTKDPRLQQTQKLDQDKYPAGQECFLTKETANSIIALENDMLDGKDVKVTSQDGLSKAITDECSNFVIIRGKKVVEDKDTQDTKK